MADTEDGKRAREDDDIPLPSAKRLRETASEDLPGLWSDEYELELPATFLEQLVRYLDECDLAYLGSASPELLKVGLFEYARRVKTAQRRGQNPVTDVPVAIDWRFATTTRKRFDEALEKKRLDQDPMRMGDGAAAAGNMPMVEHIRDTYGYEVGPSTSWAAAAYGKTEFIKLMLRSPTMHIHINEGTVVVAAANGNLDILTCIYDSGVVIIVRERTYAITHAIIRGAVMGNRLESLLWIEARLEPSQYHPPDQLVKDYAISELTHGDHEASYQEPSREILEYVIDADDTPEPHRDRRSNHPHRRVLNSAFENGKRTLGEFMIAERGCVIPRDAFVHVALAHNYEWAESLVARTTFAADVPTITRGSPVDEADIGSRVLLLVAAFRANFGAWEWGCKRGYEVDKTQLEAAAQSNSLEIVQWFHANRRALFFSELWTVWSNACCKGSLRVIEWMYSHEDWRPIVNLESMNDALVGASPSVKLLLAGWRRERWARISLAHLAQSSQ